MIRLPGALSVLAVADALLSGLHQGEHVTSAVQHLHGFLTGLIAETVQASDIRAGIARRAGQQSGPSHRWMRR
jgi:mannose-6-phosphate isomerase class I